MENTLILEFLKLLPENASESEIENAYRALALFYHPDKNLERKEWANEKMKQLNEARQILLDSSKRAIFMQKLQNLKMRQNNQVNHIQRLQNENQALRNNLQSNNQAILGLALLLLGGAIMARN